MKAPSMNTTVFTLTLAAAAIGLSLLGFVEQDSLERQRIEASQLAYVPVLSLNTNSETRVPLRFTNTSQDTFWYFFGVPHPSSSYLQLLLLKNGELVKGYPSLEQPPIEKDLVRTLKPGESVDQTIKLTSWYLKIEPGLYELRARYRVEAESRLHTEYGLTPVDFERTVAYLNIE